MSSFPILSILIALPLIGAILALFIKGNDDEVSKNVRDLATWFSLAELLLVLFLIFQYEPEIKEFQFTEKILLLDKYEISYYLGVDAISLIFICLTAILVPICIYYSKFSIKIRIKEFLIAFLVLEAVIIGVFSALDIILFYIFFESILIPMFLIIGIWGGKRRIFSSFKFFLYTLAGSVFFLIAIIVMGYQANTTSIPELDNYFFDNTLQKWLWIGMFLSFAIKVPMWPFHTWLPDAHVEAPTIGSIILAGILLKVGGYAFLRISLPILPDASFFFSNFVILLSVIAIIYTSLVALAQNDMKKLIAYSSVAHMGYVTAGIFSMTSEGINGAIFQMLSHGVVSSALFLSVGVLYERTRSREIISYNLLVKSMPKFSFFFVIIVLASVGLPGTSGFIGEMLIVLGTYKYYPLLAFLVATGIILGAIYMLMLTKNIIFTSNQNSESTKIKDINQGECSIFIIFIVAIFILGLMPNFILDFIKISSDTILANISLK